MGYPGGTVVGRRRVTIEEGGGTGDAPGDRREVREGQCRLRSRHHTRLTIHKKSPSHSPLHCRPVVHLLTSFWFNGLGSYCCKYKMKNCVEKTGGV